MGKISEHGIGQSKSGGNFQQDDQKNFQNCITQFLMVRCRDHQGEILNTLVSEVISAK